MDKQEVKELVAECCDIAADLILKLRRLDEYDSDASACIAEAVVEDDEVWISEICAEVEGE